MIKLIATDLDGTMLDDSKRLPENFDAVLQDLNRRNIRFAVSSGRSFCTLKQQFKSYLDDLIFICDNGAYVYDKGEVVSMSVLPDDAVHNIIRYCEEQGLLILLCGKHGTWHNGSSAEELEEIRKYYLNEQHLDDLSSFSDEIFKVAVFERKGKDIYSTVRVPYSTLILGGQVTVDTLHGPVNCKIREGTRAGSKIRLKGKGMPALKKKDKTGDQYVTVEVLMPAKVSEETKRKLRECAAEGV